MQDYLETILKGGPLMIPIFICSVIAVAILVERLVALRGKSIFPAARADEIFRKVKAGDLEGAIASAKEAPTTLSVLVIACLESAPLGRAQAKERMEEEGSVEVVSLSRYVQALSTIATVSPLFGLLGTVTGMVKVFKSVAAADNPEVSQLAGGIWEALLTTVAGLAVAIPSYLAYRYLESRIDRIASSLQEYGLRLLEQVFPNPGNDSEGKSP